MVIFNARCDQSEVKDIYDGAGQTMGVINAKSDGTVINRFTYTFDNAGNRLTKAEVGSVRTTWTYDNTSQLIREQRNGANSLDVTHIYDPVGNRTVQIDSGVRTTATFNADNQLLTEITGAARTTYTNDSCGNRTKKEEPADTTFYTWDTCRNLSVVELPAGKVTLTYNAAGKRVKKETASDTKKFLYDFERLLQESDGSDTVQQIYTSTEEQYGDLLSQYDGTNTLYHQYDALGSTDALINDAEAATDRYVYRAFGLQTQTTGNNDNPFTFVGKQNYYRDSETDLYFLDARYYDPESGRFISEAPLGYEAGDFNLFLYVKNNPINGIDPSGLPAPAAAAAPVAGACASPSAVVANPAIPAAILAAILVLAACGIPHFRYVRSQYNTVWTNDKWAHCVVACRISKLCGNIISTIGTFSFEIFQEFMRALGWMQTAGFDWADMQANLRGIRCSGWETSVPIAGPLGGLIFRESCVRCCDRYYSRRI